ncbi:3'-5' exonuclease, partial [Rhizobium ruizarguesonis]
MSVHRDSQLDMFAKASPAIAKVRGPSRRQPSQPTAYSDEDMARTLEESGNYRILRKLAARPIASVRRPEFSRLGVILDTETTSLNHRSDEIIEIGAVAFTFNDDGAIGDIVGIYGGLQQPSRPIPPEISRLTGINDAMVEGQLIDIQSLRTLIEPADMIIAHNAGFDRPFCEAFSKIFTGKAWA